MERYIVKEYRNRSGKPYGDIEFSDCVITIYNNKTDFMKNKAKHKIGYSKKENKFYLKKGRNRETTVIENGYLLTADIGYMGPDEQKRDNHTGRFLKKYPIPRCNIVTRRVKIIIDKKPYNYTKLIKLYKKGLNKALSTPNLLRLK